MIIKSYGFSRWWRNIWTCGNFLPRGNWTLRVSARRNFHSNWTSWSLMRRRTSKFTVWTFKSRVFFLSCKMVVVHSTEYHNVDSKIIFSQLCIVRKRNLTWSMHKLLHPAGDQERRLPKIKQNKTNYTLHLCTDCGGAVVLWFALASSLITIVKLLP